MDERTRDENLLVVAAVEGYARHHCLPAGDVLDMFLRQGLLSRIRDNYPVLHTLSLSETVGFAEDVLAHSKA